MMRFGAGMLWFVRGAALVAFGSVTAGACAQSAPQLPPHEDARLALIDYCVVSESGHYSQFDDFVSICKCATNKLLGEMSEDEMKGVAKWRKPTSSVKKRWDTDFASCKN